MTEKNERYICGGHIYKNNICVICGHKSKYSPVYLHGRCVCEDCVQYICEDKYAEETKRRFSKRKMDKD